MKKNHVAGCPVFQTTLYLPTCTAYMLTSSMFYSKLFSFSFQGDTSSKGQTYCFCVLLSLLVPTYFTLPLAIVPQIRGLYPAPKSHELSEPAHLLPALSKRYLGWLSLPVYPRPIVDTRPGAETKWCLCNPLNATLGMCMHGNATLGIWMLGEVNA